MSGKVLLPSELEKASPGTILLFTSGSTGDWRWVIKGTLKSVKGHGAEATICVTEVVSQGRRAQPPKVGKEFTGGWSGFKLTS